MIHTDASRQIIQKYVPTAAVDYCLDLLNHYGFRLKITRSRKTKLGDYRFLSQEQKHVITVNNDLNRYQFLVTYLHEVAHLITFESHQNRIQPHGKEWKNNFRDLLEPLNKSSVFPQHLMEVVDLFLKTPKASSCADPTLFKALGQYDGKKDGGKCWLTWNLETFFNSITDYFRKNSRSEPGLFVWTLRRVSNTLYRKWLQ